MEDNNIYEPIEIFLNKNNIDYDTDYEKDRVTVSHWLILDNNIITKELDNKIREFLDTLEDAEHWDITTTSDDNEYLIVHTDYDLTDTMYEQKLYTSINEFKQYNESMNEEEDLYHDIDWKDLELDMTEWFNRQPQKLDYDTFVKTFARTKEKILQYKMTN